MAPQSSPEVAQAIETKNWHLALHLLNEIVSSGANSPQVYETRSVVFEKLGLFKEAYADAKKSPMQIQKFARVSRLLLLQASTRQKPAAGSKGTAAEGYSPPPINRLPTETLLDIFTYYNAGDNHFVLIAVCCLWKEIITSDPRFWRTLSITPTNPSKDRLRNWIKFYRGRVEKLTFSPGLSPKTANMVLTELSQGPISQPITDISISQQHIIATRHCKHNLLSPKLIVALECHSKRDAIKDGAHSAVLRPPEAKFIIDDIFPNREEDELEALPSLEQLRVSWPIDHSRWPSMPRLKKLEIVLSSLHQPISVNGFLDILTQSSDSLESFSLSMQTRPSAPGESISRLGSRIPITLPKLNDIQLAIHGDTAYPEALALLQVPNLRTLGLSYFRRPVTDYLRALTPYLGEVTWFLSRAVVFDDETLLQYLALMPNLVSLGLQGGIESSTTKVKRVLAGLGKPRAGVYLLPHLRNLDVTRTTDTVEACLALVRGRKRQSSLREEEVASGRSSSTSLFTQLRPARLETLLVDVGGSAQDLELATKLKREVSQLMVWKPKTRPTPSELERQQQQLREAAMTSRSLVELLNESGYL